MCWKVWKHNLVGTFKGMNVKLEYTVGAFELSCNNISIVAC